MTGAVRTVDDPAELAELFGRDRACHLYGLADLVEPYWSASTWWRRGDAAVGVVPLPDSDQVAFYAVSPAAPAETIALFVEVHEHVPQGGLGSGPVGLVEALRPHRRLDDLGVRRKLVVDPDDLVVPAMPGGHAVRRLGPTDVDRIRALHASDPGAAFLVPSMLVDGHHVGALDTDGALVAAAGTHVLERASAVAAIGAVITHPAHRGRGLAGALVGHLARSLLAEGLTVGLNVSEHNLTARRLYDRLGFRPIHVYEEARLR